MSAALQTLLEAAAAAGVFPSARAVVLLNGERVFEGGAGGAAPETVFDLASLTKVMSTTALFLFLWSTGKVAPETPVSDFFPASKAGQAGVTLGDLLYHRSGLPPFVPYFAAALRGYPRLLETDCPSMLRDEARQDIVRAVLATPLEHPVRSTAAYSDVGFILLGEVLSKAFGRPLDSLFADPIAARLSLAARFRSVGARPPAGPALAPTGSTRPRECAPGQEGLWEKLPSAPSVEGEVDDDNAWAMGGTAGHAGLFGTAADLARFGQGVLEELAGACKLAPAPLWERAAAVDLHTPGSTRALGFDTPSAPGASPGSSAGTYIGRKAPGAVGHLGFTGTSLWVDRARALVVALCTNRTFLGRADTRIREFRPRFHDAIIRAFHLE